MGKANVKIYDLWWTFSMPIPPSCSMLLLFLWSLGGCSWLDETDVSQRTKYSRLIFAGPMVTADIGCQICELATVCSFQSFAKSRRSDRTQPFSSSSSVFLIKQWGPDPDLLLLWGCQYKARHQRRNWNQRVNMCFLLQRGDASKETLIIHHLIYNWGGATFNRRWIQRCVLVRRRSERRRQEVTGKSVRTSSDL